MADKRKDDTCQDPFDAAEFLNSLQDQEQPVDIDTIHAKRVPTYFRRMVKSNPAYAIADFLGKFGFRDGNAKLAYQPEQFVLEYLAKCFHAYWNGDCGSLDDAFGLKGKGRGEKTPKERYKGRVQQFKEDFVYQGYLQEFQADQQAKQQKLTGEPPPHELAIKKTAEYFGVNENVMRDRVWRRK